MENPTHFAIPADAPHLGGYITGGDQATYFPVLWDYLVGATCRDDSSTTNWPKRMVRVLDIGAGDNVAVRYFRTNPRVAVACGVDGCPGISDVCHDFSKGLLRDVGDFDLVWSCEFVEHVEERYLPFVLDALTRAPLLAMTYAVPGQSGHHHVNCRPEAYWAGALAGFGMRVDPELTTRARLEAARNSSPWNHFKDRGLVFTRKFAVRE